MSHLHFLSTGNKSLVATYWEAIVTINISQVTWTFRLIKELRTEMIYYKSRGGRDRILKESLENMEMQ